MKIIISALLLAIALIGIPVVLVKVPTVAAHEIESSKPVVDSKSARAHCGVRMECLQ